MQAKVIGRHGAGNVYINQKNAYAANRPSRTLRGGSMFDQIDDAVDAKLSVTGGGAPPRV